MVKPLVKWRIVTVVLALSLAIAGSLAHTVSPASLAQGSNRSQPSRVLPIALPNNATVRLTQGGSRSGELKRLTSTNLTLSAAGQSQTLPLSQVRQLELRGQVAVPNPDGTTRLLPIRGVSQSIPDVPVAALTWAGRPSLATLNLRGVLSQAEFNRLAVDPSLIYALTQIEFETADRTTMNVRVKALKKP